MKLHVTICAKDLATEIKWANQFQSVLAEMPSVQVELFHQTHRLNQLVNQLVIVDGDWSDAGSFISHIDRKEKVIFLLQEDHTDPSPLWNDGQVDELIVTPVRKLDLVSKFRNYEHHLMWNEVSQLNTSISNLLENLHEDLLLTEQLQKANLPKRFSDLQGLHIATRYLAGLKSGGDYFDIAESNDKSTVTLVMTHSTSYGLNNQILSALIRVATHFSSDHMQKVGSTLDTILKLDQDLTPILKDKDRLSLFYGVVSHSDQSLRFYNIGNSALYYAPSQQEFRELPRQGDVLSKQSRVEKGAEISLSLDLNGRIVLLSPGCHEILQSLGKESVLTLLNRFRSQEAEDLLNECAYLAKSKLKSQDDLLEQDCSMMVIEIGKAQLISMPTRDT